MYLTKNNALGKDVLNDSTFFLHFLKYVLCMFIL